MPGWNFADAWETVAGQGPRRPVPGAGRPAGHVGRVRPAGQRRRPGRCSTAARQEQDKVAQYLYNCPEYLESMFAAFKAGLVPVNTNYRYADDELVYLWDNADCVAVVFHGTFADRIERIRDRVPARRDVALGRRRSAARRAPSWATPYEDAAAARHRRDRAGPVGPRRRPPPHALHGRHHRHAQGRDVAPGRPVPQPRPARSTAASREDPVDYDVVDAGVGGPGFVGLPACPLMHGTGCFTQLILLSGGGSTVLLESRNLDVVELLDTIEREKVNPLVIVGDAFAKPILRALDANPGRWDLSSLFMIASSGVMFSEESKQGLLAPQPDDDDRRRLLVVGGRSAWASRCRPPAARRTRRSSRSARTPR